MIKLLTGDLVIDPPSYNHLKAVSLNVHAVYKADVMHVLKADQAPGSCLQVIKTAANSPHSMLNLQ